MSNPERNLQSVSPWLVPIPRNSKGFQKADNLNSSLEILNNENGTFLNYFVKQPVPEQPQRENCVV